MFQYSILNQSDDDFDVDAGMGDDDAMSDDMDGDDGMDEDEEESEDMDA